MPLALGMLTPVTAVPPARDGRNGGHAGPRLSGVGQWTTGTRQGVRTGGGDDRACGWVRPSSGAVGTRTCRRARRKAVGARGS